MSGYLTKIFIAIASQVFLVLLGFWVVNKIILPFVKNEKWHDRLSFYAPVLRNILFGLIILQTVVIIGSKYPLVSIGLLAGMIAMTWGFSKEVVQGTIFKLQRGNIVGQRIKLKEYSGKVVNMNDTKLELESEQGEVIQIPYSDIANSVEVKPSSARYLKSCSVKFQLNNENHITFQKKVLDRIGSIPYVITSIQPKFEVIQTEGNQTELKVVVYTNSEEYIPTIRKQLMSV
ncbi:MAG: hypothetical protein ACJA1A_003715 [Saprospiraceae bacterium]|jgi:hypothetical protein